MSYKNFQELSAENSLLLQYLSIWEEVENHLRKFLDTDAIPARFGIVSKSGSFTVLQKSIEKVLMDVQSIMAGLKSKLEDMNKYLIVEDTYEKTKNKGQFKKGKNS